MVLTWEVLKKSYSDICYSGKEDFAQDYCKVQRWMAGVAGVVDVAGVPQLVEASFHTREGSKVAGLIPGLGTCQWLINGSLSLSSSPFSL